MVLEVIMVPKAGLEPARISTVDFESTASTDFATPALERYAENVEDYTCSTPPCKHQRKHNSLSVEKISTTPILVTFSLATHNPPFRQAPRPHMLYTLSSTPH